MTNFEKNELWIVIIVAIVAIFSILTLVFNNPFASLSNFESNTELSGQAYATSLSNANFMKICFTCGNQNYCKTSIEITSEWQNPKQCTNTLFLQGYAESTCKKTNTKATNVRVQQKCTAVITAD